jgi:hypothetical protein
MKPAQPFQQQGPAINVGVEQPDAAAIRGEPQDRYLVLRVPAGPGDMQLQDGGGAVAQRRLGDERLGRIVICPADADRPVPFQAGDQIGQVAEPLPGPGGQRLVAHHVPDGNHQVSVICWPSSCGSSFPREQAG